MSEEITNRKIKSSPLLILALMMSSLTMFSGCGNRKPAKPTTSEQDALHLISEELTKLDKNDDEILTYGELMGSEVLKIANEKFDTRVSEWDENKDGILQIIEERASREGWGLSVLKAAVEVALEKCVDPELLESLKKIGEEIENKQKEVAFKRLEKHRLRADSNNRSDIPATRKYVDRLAVTATTELDIEDVYGSRTGRQYVDGIKPKPVGKAGSISM